MFVFYTLSGNTLVDSIAPWKQWSWGALSGAEHLLWNHTDVQSCRQIPSLLCISVEQVENNCWRFRIFKDTSALVAGEQKRTRKTNLDWKGVTPFAQARDVDNGTQSRFWEPRWSSNWNARNLWNVIVLKRTWASMVTFDWLLHMHGCHEKDKWHVKVKFRKSQELASWARHTGTRPFWRIFLSIPPSIFT